MTAVEAPNQDQLGRLADFGTATVYEASGIDCALDPALRPVWPGARIVGRALPVRCHPADNLALHRALEQASAGDVLVVDGGEERCGYWGEVMAVAAQQRGIAGLVIDGGVRDVDQMQGLQFPVFARWVCVRRTGKHWAGSVGSPLVVAGVPVSSGDVVVADTDGVVVLPADAVEPTLEASGRRVDAEDGYLRRLRGGELTVDIMGLRRD
jgi:4-hydroxy-4-methyl-2-oxoglutarate aldolase